MIPRIITKLALSSILCAVMPLLAGAQSGSSAAAPIDPSLGITSIPLWSNSITVGDGSTGPIPTLTVFPPFNANSGAAVIVAPGGAYALLASNNEGRQVADWFAARGVTAFVLRYRLGPQNLFPVPLEDAQRAIRMVRYNAAKYHISPDRIGMMGFSAGGHLAATAGTLFDSGNPGASDPIDRVSDRPDFMILAYAWLNAMQPNNQGMITYCSILKTVPEANCRSYEQAYTPALHVTANTPPAFLFATSDDKVVPVRASVDFYEALLKEQVPAEMHLFAHGLHGSALGSGDPVLDSWPIMLDQWLRAQGLLTPKPADRERK